MRAGQLRHRIKIQRVVETQDSFGEADAAFYTLGTYWAQVEDVNGMEVFTDDALRSKRTSRITCRWSSELSDVDPKHRILLGEEVLDVQQVLNVEHRNRTLQILATVRDG